MIDASLRKPEGQRTDRYREVNGGGVIDTKLGIVVLRVEVTEMSTGYARTLVKTILDHLNGG